MQTNDDGRNRFRWGGLATLVCASVVAIIWLLRGSHPARREPEAQTMASSGADALRAERLTTVRSATPPPIASSPATRADDPNLPVVDQLEVEKPEVCRGEVNFVDVKLHTRNGTDAFLAVTVTDPQSGRVVRGGPRLPFRVSAAGEQELQIAIEGKTTGMLRQLPPFRIKDCVVRHQVSLAATRTMNATDRIHFHATVTTLEADAGAGDAFVPVTYRWDFGDGSSQVTTTAEVDHSYEARDQTVAVSSFLASVTLVDRAGVEAQGWESVAFTNLGFGALLADGHVNISVGVRAASAKEHERIWLYHGYPLPVHLDRATLRETILTAPDKPEVETFSRSYSPIELLGFADLPARESRTARDLTDLAPTAAGAVRYVDLYGSASDGKEARARFTLLPESAPSEPATTQGGSYASTP